MDTHADRTQNVNFSWQVPSKADLRAAGQVQSLSRALKLLNALSHHPQGLTLSGIARLVGLPPSTAHRLLTTLQTERFIRFDGGPGLWRVGIQAFRVGGAYAACDLVNIMRPYLARLSELSGERASVAIAEHGELAVLDSIENRRAIAADGGQPLAKSAGGLALLAVDRRRGPINGQPALAEARQRGYAVCREDHAGERIGVAAAITGDHGQALAALIVSAPAARMTPERTHELGATVLAMARQVAVEARGKLTL